MTAPARVLASVLAVCGLAGAAHAQSPVTYRLDYRTARAPRVQVRLSWAAPLPTATALVMPRAIPMGYGEQRYDAFVDDVQMLTDRGARPAPRVEGPRWMLDAGTTGVTYAVDLAALERRVTAASDQSRVRDGYLGALGYAVFAFVDGFETRPVRLTISGPPAWPVFSTLAPAAPPATGEVVADAPDFYALADSQIVMGPKAVVRRLATTPAAVYLVSYAEGPVDLDRVGRLALTAFQRVAD